MVAIPTLLLNEKQVRKLVDDLEVRYLGNQDRKLHFALAHRPSRFPVGAAGKDNPWWTSAGT